MPVKEIHFPKDPSDSSPIGLQLTGTSSNAAVEILQQGSGTALEVVNNAGTALFSVSKAGAVVAAGVTSAVTGDVTGTASGNPALAPATAARNTVQPSADVVPVTIKGKVSQTAALTEWQDSAGSVLASVTAAGKITAASRVDATDNIRARLAGAAQVHLGDVGPSSEAGLLLGSGNDTNLYRGAANLLKTDDKFVTVAGLGVGNSATANTLGTVTRKIEVFDASGASLGFLPVYDAITTV